MTGYKTQNNMKIDFDPPSSVTLSKVCKKYYLHHAKPTLVENILHQKNEGFWALRDITMAIKKGDKVGIVGPNGSGKTTLLKIIAGISSPTSGSIKTRGRLVSLIDVGAGFHPDLTGVKNIFLNGLLIGMDRKEITRKLKKIVAFSGVGEFIDLPLFTYSEGMKLRLGMAIAIHADPDVLVLDEGFGVGDQKFKEKIKRVYQELFKGKTVIVVSHDMYTIIDYCDKVFVMDKGRILYQGSVKSAIKKYKGNYNSSVKWYINQKRQNS